MASQYVKSKQPTKRKFKTPEEIKKEMEKPIRWRDRKDIKK